MDKVELIKIKRRLKHLHKQESELWELYFKTGNLPVLESIHEILCERTVILNLIGIQNEVSGLDAGNTHEILEALSAAIDAQIEHLQEEISGG